MKKTDICAEVCVVLLSPLGPVFCKLLSPLSLRLGPVFCLVFVDVLLAPVDEELLPISRQCGVLFVIRSASADYATLLLAKVAEGIQGKGITCVAVESLADAI